MKKTNIFLITVFVIAFSAQLNAQFIDAVNYRGAFAPAPENMWTDSWTNWDPQNTPYAATTVIVTGIISSNTTWTRNNVYLLNGVVYVDTLVTLTIEAGTVIRGNFFDKTSSLIVQRGAKLNANGTQCNPIVFTSNRAVGDRAKGDWGGVILLGRALNNVGNTVLIEGLNANTIRNYHGGNVPADNSGSLKYVRIEYGGFILSGSNEINGLTMGSVGSGTTIDNVQCSFIDDDAFEWFGGAVNCKHLVAYRCVDDNFDTDNGYSGFNQYLLGVKDPSIADVVTGGSSEGFESDNDVNGSGRLPKTSATFYNVTEIGAYRCPTPTMPAPLTQHNRSLRLRRNGDLKIYNSIFMNSRIGLFLDGTDVFNNANEDSLVFRNNIIAADYSGYPGHRAAENANSRTVFTNPAYQNDSINTCSLLVNAFNYTNPDYRPNTAGAGAAVLNNVKVAPDLTPIIETDGTLFTPSQSLDFVVNIIETGVGSTSGQISFTISKMPGWDITVPSLALTGTNQSGTNGNSNVSGGTANANGSWLFRDNGSSIVVTSKPGVIINLSGLSIVGFTATRKTSTPSGTSQNLSLSINDGSGGDYTTVNNSTVLGFSTSN